MDAELLKKQLDSLDPRIHVALRDVLLAEYNRIADVRDDRLNEIWDAGLRGKAGIEEFRDVPDEWYRLHLQGIEIFAGKKGG
jgi:hypothetical protein